jgi:hypothetical protein
MEIIHNDKPMGITTRLQIGSVKIITVNIKCDKIKWLYRLTMINYWLR